MNTTLIAIHSVLYRLTVQRRSDQVIKHILTIIHKLTTKHLILHLHEHYKTAVSDNWVKIHKSQVSK